MFGPCPQSMSTESPAEMHPSKQADYLDMVDAVLHPTLAEKMSEHYLLSTTQPTCLVTHLINEHLHRSTAFLTGPFHGKGATWHWVSYSEVVRELCPAASLLYLAHTDLPHACF